MGLPATEGEAILAVVGFRPPSVQDGEIQSAVEHDFLSAGSAGLQRSSRVVRPDVDTLDEMPPHVDVVVLEKQDLARETRVPHQLRNLLQELLAGLIMRVRLARKNE